MGSQINIAFQEVAFILHIQKLCCHGKSSQGTIAVGYIAHSIWTSSDPSKPAHKANGGGGAVLAASILSFYQNPYDIGASFWSNDGDYFHISIRTDPQKMCFDGISICMGTVQ